MVDSPLVASQRTRGTPRSRIARARNVLSAPTVVKDTADDERLAGAFVEKSAFAYFTVKLRIAELAEL